MDPLSGITSAAYPSGLTAIHGSACLLRARYVAVVFKERRYDTDAPKTWWLAHIDHVAVVTGRLQLLREGYGVVFDVPYNEVEQVYTLDQDKSLPRVHASHMAERRHEGSGDESRQEFVRALADGSIRGTSGREG